ncbi:type IV pilus modification PilV family protein [Thermovibrio sp.]
MEKVASKRLGFSIVEVLISMVVLSIVLIGLLSSILVYIRINQQNDIRNIANQILVENLEKVKSEDYSDITPAINNGSTSCKDALVNKKNVEIRFIRNKKLIFGKFFDISDNSTLRIKRVKVEICWFFRGNFYSINGTTIVR